MIYLKCRHKPQGVTVVGSKINCMENLSGSLLYGEQLEAGQAGL